MIDIHTHILPGVDDGSPDPETTCRMLRLSREHGVTDIAATSHFYASSDTMESFLQRRGAAYERIPQQDDMPRIHLGAEVAYFAGISNSDELTQLQIGNTGLILIEMPFVPWTKAMVEDVCNMATHLRLQPVLAHVERYRGMGQIKQYLPQLLEADVLLQCNAGAFQSGFKGKWALDMLRKGNIHFIGSDCHNMAARPPRMDAAAKVIQEKCGQQALQDLTDFARTYFPG